MWFPTTSDMELTFYQMNKNFVRFKDLEHVQDYYDDTCNRLGRPPVKLRITSSRGVDYAGICHLMTPYFIEFTDKLFSMRWEDLREENRSPQDLCCASDYIVYHELFHHISGLFDGPNFEYQLREFIRRETYKIKMYI